MISLSPKLLLKVVFHCDKLREYKTLTFFFKVWLVFPPNLFVYRSRMPHLSVLCRHRFHANFALLLKETIETYKRTTWLFVSVCVFLLLFESRDHVWPRDAPKRIPRTKNRLSLLVVFAKKVCTQKLPKVCNFSIWVRVSGRLT